jgi:hypothetical protein
MLAPFQNPDVTFPISKTIDDPNYEKIVVKLDYQILSRIINLLNLIRNNFSQT